MKRVMMVILGGAWLAVGGNTADAALVFLDNFNRDNVANYDTVDQDAAQSGSHASAIELRASRAVFGITSNEASWGATQQGRVRFHQQTGPGTTGGRFDFASVMAGNSLLRVEWDVNWDSTTDWTAFNFGSIGITSGEPTILVNNAATDVGILIKKAVDDVEVFDNGVLALNVDTIPYTRTGVGHIRLDLSYAGINTGDALTLNAWVDNVQVVTNLGGLTWNNLAAEGGINLEFEQRNGPTRIDNLSITVVPEPTTITLAAFAGLAVVAFRRRRS